jgi:TolB protein
MSRTLSISIRTLALAASTLAGIAACHDQDPVQPKLPNAQVAAENGQTSFIKNKPQFYFNGIMFTGTHDAPSGELYTANPDGSGVTRVTFDDSSDVYPDVSPVGPSFIWARRTNGVQISEIYSQNFDGTHRKRLTSLNTTITYPRYSPDGTKIVFAAVVGMLGPEIFVMNANGTGITRLTFTGKTSTSPSWSPDGSMIAFSSYDNNGIPGVWTMTANGSFQKLVKTCPQPGCVRLKWSPVANELAVEHLDGSGIFVIDATTGAQAAYIPGSVDDMMPTWSKDGSKIVFASHRSQNGAYDLYSTIPMRRTMTVPPSVDRLTSFIGQEVYPAYSR